VRDVQSKGISKTVIGLLIVFLVLGGGIGYYLAPTKVVQVTTTQVVSKSPLEGQTVKQGFITAATSDLETYQTYYRNIIDPDMNAYIKMLGYGFTFQTQIDDANNQINIHLEKVQAFHSGGVNIVTNQGGSSLVQGSLSYVNSNNMLLWSGSSSSPTLAIPNDNLFRLFPTDLVQAPIIAKMMWSYGIKACVVIHEGTSYGDGLYNIFKTEFPKLGGVILTEIRYATETVDFSTYCQAANEAITQANAQYGVGRVGVFCVVGTPIAQLVTQASSYKVLYDSPWFGADASALSQRLIDDASEAALHIRFISTMPVPGETVKFTDLNKRFHDQVRQNITAEATNVYDISYVNLQGIINTQSVNPMGIIPLIPSICYNTFGASGWLRLDANGDRYSLDYNLYGVMQLNGKAQWVAFGKYTVVTNRLEWYTNILDFQLLGP
jgi:branched-chain amino acid transport system substrate-binding protein